MQSASRPSASAPPREALFLPLGYSRHGAETWIHLLVGDEVRTYRPSQSLGLAFLIGIYPDHDHWVRMYPSETYNGRKVDWRRACTSIIRLCIEAGEYVPKVAGDTPGNVK